MESGFKECLKDAKSTYEMKDCTSQARQGADRVLNSTYKRITAELSVKSGEQYLDDANSETMSRLVAAERAWIAFRDAECKLQGTRSLGGTMEGLDVLLCLYEETVKRVKSLEDLFKG